MLKSRIIITIITLLLTACNSLPERQSNSADRVAGQSVTHTRSGNTSGQPPGKKQLTARHTVTSEPQAATTAEIEYNDVWERIREQMQLYRHPDNATVKARLAWYARHQSYLDRVAERAKPYIYHIVNALEERNMPLELALLPIVESAYHPFAYSRSHASGIWQFIPGTGKLYGLKQNWWYDGRRDIVAATDAALDYLEKLNKEFKGNWLHALAAYNTGERNVARAIERNRAAGKDTEFWDLRLPRETRGYVPSLLAVAELLASPAKHGVSWQAIENKPYFSIVPVDRQLDLAIAARLADLSMDELYTLNPGFNRWATDPEGPHRLLIPVEKTPAFINKLQALPEDQRISWRRHVIKRGENLGLIAQRYHTSVDALKQTNKLQSNLIREGQSLIIANAQQPSNHYTLSMDARLHRGLKKSGDGNSHIYTVRKGDTLWNISRQYGVSIKQLCAWNSLQAKSVLRPGKKLTLWLAAKDAKSIQAIPASYSKTKTEALRYTVKKGDSLWLIARRFDTSVNKLLSLNKLTSSKYLKPGQKLIIRTAENTVTGV